MANKERIKEWVAALRSGKYKQGSSQLRKDDCYCCLAVACDICKLGNWENIGGGNYRYFIDIDDEHELVLPYSVRDYFGLASIDPKVFYDPSGTFVELHELNDDEGLNFNEIADLIERKYLPD